MNRETFQKLTLPEALGRIWDALPALRGSGEQQSIPGAGGSSGPRAPKFDTRFKALAHIEKMTTATMVRLKEDREALLATLPAVERAKCERILGADPVV